MSFFDKCVVLLMLLAFRFPVIDRIVGWVVVFPLMTFCGGTLAWIVIQLSWGVLSSLAGYLATLAVVAVPVAYSVVWTNRS